MYNYYFCIYYKHRIIYFILMYAIYSVPLTNALCMFVDDCDESSVVSDDGDGKSSESVEGGTCWSIWLSPGGANTSPIESIRCEE